MTERRTLSDRMMIEALARLAKEQEAWDSQRSDLVRLPRLAVASYATTRHTKPTKQHQAA